MWVTWGSRAMLSMLTRGFLAGGGVFFLWEGVEEHPMNRGVRDSKRIWILTMDLMSKVNNDRGSRKLWREIDIYDKANAGGALFFCLRRRIGAAHRMAKP